MTTPDPASPPDPAAARITRPQPARTAPDRSGTTARAAASAAAAAPPSSMAGPAGPADPVRQNGEAAIDESIASSVKTAYDVLAESIEQGRKSAASFREGDYNFRDVPGDVRHLAANLLKLARQLSATTFDLCETLLSQQSPLGALGGLGGLATPPPPGTTPVPPFRPGDADAAASGADLAPGSAAPPQAAAPVSTTSGTAAVMSLTVDFVGVNGARPLSGTLTRPELPVHPEAITASPLSPRLPGAAPLTAVSFAADLVNGGLRATVSVPPGQPGGVYSGAVYAPNRDAPLGLMVVELPEASPAASA